MLKFSSTSDVWNFRLQSIGAFVNSGSMTQPIISIVLESVSIVPCMHTLLAQYPLHQWPNGEALADNGENHNDIGYG